MRDKTLAAIVLIGSVLLLTRSVFGDTTYYVDSIDGADGNPGTSAASAWRTIARVNSAALKPGDAVLFRRGQEWREQLVLSSSGEVGRPIVYASYGRLGGRPRINGADIYDGNHWDHEGGSVWSKPNHLPFDAEFAAGDTARNKFVVTIDGIRYIPVVSVDDLREYTYTYDNRSDKLLVFLADDPDGHVTESATRHQSIYVKGQRHIVVRDLEVMNSVSDNMYVVRGCKHILIENVTSHHAGSRGLLITGDDLAVDPQGWAEHIAIESCIFYNNGIRCDTAANDIGMSRNVRRVTIKKCVLHGDGKNWGVDGILLGGSSNGAGHLIEGNLIFGHCENEIDFKGHFESPGKEGRTVIQHNVLSESGGAVVNIHYGSRHIDILYNQISLGQTYGVSLYNHGGSGAYDGEEGDVTMAYNVIRDNLRAGIRDGGRGRTVTAGGNRVYNNVIVKNGRRGDLAGIAFQSFGWDIRNNIIWDNCGGDADRQLRPETWQSRAGLTASHNLIGERPLFVNAEDNDFRLQAGSPAIDAGIHLGFDRDLDGQAVPSGKTPDIGAYEYDTGSPTYAR